MTAIGPDQDLSHGIPRLDTLDTLLETNAGARVGIVIATPLRDNPRDRDRFERKLQVALAYFTSEAFQSRWGAPDPSHCALYIDIHSTSDGSIIDLVFGQADRIRAAGLTPVIKVINAN
jgi:hypothetical protein